MGVAVKREAQRGIIMIETTGKQIRRAREKRGISQRTLADKTGFTHSAISNWERGVQEPSDRAAQGIAEFLGLDFARISKLLMLERYNRKRTRLER